MRIYECIFGFLSRERARNAISEGSRLECGLNYDLNGVGSLCGCPSCVEDHDYDHDHDHDRDHHYYKPQVDVEDEDLAFFERKRRSRAANDS